MNQLCVELTLHYKYESKVLVVIIFGIPRNYSRQAVYVALKQACRSSRYNVDMKRRRDGRKCAFCHLQTEETRCGVPLKKGNKAANALKDLNVNTKTKNI